MRLWQKYFLDCQFFGKCKKSSLPKRLTLRDRKIGWCNFDKNFLDFVIFFGKSKKSSLPERLTLRDRNIDWRDFDKNIFLDFVVF